MRRRTWVEARKHIPYEFGMYGGLELIGFQHLMGSSSCCPWRAPSLACSSTLTWTLQHMPLIWLNESSPLTSMHRWWCIHFRTKIRFCHFRKSMYILVKMNSPIERFKTIILFLHHSIVISLPVEPLSMLLRLSSQISCLHELSPCVRRSKWLGWMNDRRKLANCSNRDYN